MLRGDGKIRRVSIYPKRRSIGVTAEGVIEGAAGVIAAASMGWLLGARRDHHLVFRGNCCDAATQRGEEGHMKGRNGRDGRSESEG